MALQGADAQCLWEWWNSLSLQWATQGQGSPQPSIVPGDRCSENVWWMHVQHKGDTGEKKSRRTGSLATIQPFSPNHSSHYPDQITSGIFVTGISISLYKTSTVCKMKSSLPEIRIFPATAFKVG
jgi:hypothetical protein